MSRAGVAALAVLLAAGPLFAADHQIVATRPAMGTLLEVTALAPSRAIARAACEAAFGEVERLDGVLSNWRESTELSRFNRRAGSGPIGVSRELHDVLAMSAAVHRASGGAFDVTLGRALLALRAGVRGTARETLPAAMGRHLHVGRGTASLERKGEALDLGGIGKGYALELARDAMRRAGATAGFLDFGRSSVGGFGPRRWQVLVRRLDGTLGPCLSLHEEFLSTSETGPGVGEILDPRTALPVPFRRLAIVRCASGALADAWTTALVVLGRRGLALLETSLAGASAWYEDASGAARTGTSELPVCHDTSPSPFAADLGAKNP